MTEPNSARTSGARDIPKRPKGILKNSSSFSNPQLAKSPEELAKSPTFLESPADTKELTLQNTLQNAGRSSRANSTASRRQSAASAANGSHAGDADENSPRLKWDEANLYLTEQDRGGKMKIDEPKTPYVPHYDPDMEEDEEADIGIHVGDLAVDELDMSKGKKSHGGRPGGKEDDIPDLELGEAEDQTWRDGWSGDHGRITVDGSKAEKHVVVGNDGDGEVPTSPEEKQKHHAFEQRRKRHYEMAGIKDLLGHPENIDVLADEDDEEEAVATPPKMPKIPDQYKTAK